MKEIEIIKKKEEFNFSKQSLPNQKLRVAAYARVSTDMEEQQTSFISQQKYYLEKITTNPNWIFVEVYADEGISGTQASKRENFMRMIDDACNGKINLILTKSISRFARNTLDTLKYVRMLKANNVGILFEEENINTLDMAGELLLTVLSSVAQQESETISSHIKLGLKMKKERGELVVFSSCYGLRYDNKTHEMKIIEKEAEIVKLIFKEYLKGYGSTAIADLLNQMKVTSPSGSNTWAACTVLQILKQEKYVGDVIQGKTYTTDSITHKRVVNNGEEDMYVMKDHHEPIVSRELFEEVQDIIRSRSNSIMTGRRRTKIESFTGRMRCGFCGQSYSRRSTSGPDKIFWVCHLAVRGIKHLYPSSKVIPEKVIKETFMEAYYLLTVNDGLALEEFMENVKEVLKDETPATMKKKYEDERRKYKAKLSKLVEIYVDGQIDKNIYARKQEELENKIEVLNQKIETLSDMNSDETKIEHDLNTIKHKIIARETSNQVKEFDKSLFDSLVDYVLIGSVDENDEPNGFILRFIIKSGFRNKSREDIEDRVITANGLNNTTDNIYIPILDFISSQKFNAFENIGYKRVKKIIDKVRVRVEMER